MSPLANSMPDFSGVGFCGSVAEATEARESAVQIPVNQ
jgi:hypothetical protein